MTLKIKPRIILGQLVIRVRFDITVGNENGDNDVIDIYVYHAARLARKLS